MDTNACKRLNQSHRLIEIHGYVVDTKRKEYGCHHPFEMAKSKTVQSYCITI